MKLQSNKGILFLITGAQGAGKTTIGKKGVFWVKIYRSGNWFGRFWARVPSQS